MKTTAFVRLAAAFALVAMVHACSSPERGDSESHFLLDCSGACEAGLECVCGVCTRTCSATSGCTALNAIADCAAGPTPGCPVAGGICDVACFTSGGCDALGSGFDCVGGRCRQVASPLGEKAVSGEEPGGAPTSVRSGGNRSLPAVDVKAACATPDGHAVPYKTLKQLESMIVGDWLICDRTGVYPAAAGIEGLRILPDRKWYALVKNAACGYDPLTTGDDVHGTWNDLAQNPDSIGFGLVGGNGGAIFNPIFSDTGQLWLGTGTPTLYVRMPTTPGTDTSCSTPDAGGGPTR